MEPVADALLGALCFTTPFVCGLLFGWLWLHYRLRMRELEVRMVEAKAHLERTRLLAGAPDWLDADDPEEVAAWLRTRREVVELTVKDPPR